MSKTCNLNVHELFDVEVEHGDEILNDIRKLFDEMPGSKFHNPANDRSGIDVSPLSSVTCKVLDQVISYVSGDLPCRNWRRNVTYVNLNAISHRISHFLIEVIRYSLVQFVSYEKRLPTEIEVNELSMGDDLFVFDRGKYSNGVFSMLFGKLALMCRGFVNEHAECSERIYYVKTYEIWETDTNDSHEFGCNLCAQRL